MSVCDSEANLITRLFCWPIRRDIEFGVWCQIWMKLHKSISSPGKTNWIFLSILLRCHFNHTDNLFIKPSFNNQFPLICTWPIPLGDWLGGEQEEIQFLKDIHASQISTLGPKPTCEGGRSFKPTIVSAASQIETTCSLDVNVKSISKSMLKVAIWQQWKTQVATWDSASSNNSRAKRQSFELGFVFIIYERINWPKLSIYLRLDSIESLRSHFAHAKYLRTNYLPSLFQIKLMTRTANISFNR